MIGNLTNYGQKKSRNKPDVSAGCRDITVWAELVGHRLSKDLFLFLFLFYLFLEKYYYFQN
jgi:hypothetical protein